jgi:hypothetical protein
MTTCANCGGAKWGMARYRALTLRGYIYFDKKSCKDDYFKRQQQDVRKRQFQDWLLKAETST